MCRFCVQHGDGEKWYLEASNYAHDLTRDLERRRYIVDFVRHFDSNRVRLISGLGLLGAMPWPIERLGKRAVSARLMRDHFGQPVPLEDAEAIFRIATSIVQLPCPCRTSSGARDEGYCFAITLRPIDDVLDEAFRDFAHGPDVSAFQRLSRDEAMARLRRSEQEGLMHSVWTFKSPFIAAMCNCDLASGCMAMRMTHEFGTKIMWKGHHVAEIDAETCTGCRQCVTHCPFGAIDHDRSRRRAEVRSRDCYGCGVCRSACTVSAIGLRERSAHPEVSSHW